MSKKHIASIATNILTNCKKTGTKLLFGLEVPESRHKMITLGVDEVGRGCLAGPVVAGCIALDTDSILNLAQQNQAPIPRIADSKRLKPEQRQEALVWLGQPRVSLAYGIGAATEQEIYDYNIQGATYIAMARAIKNCLAELSAQHPELDTIPRHVIVDGNRWQHPSSHPEFKPSTCPPSMDPNTLKVSTMIKGDDKHLAIAAASILAKQHRDGYLDNLVKKYPRLACYDWYNNRGYGSPVHITAILYHGITSYHRVKFLSKMFPPLSNTAAVGVAYSHDQN